MSMLIHLLSFFIFYETKILSINNGIHRDSKLARDKIRLSLQFLNGLYNVHTDFALVISPDR